MEAFILITTSRQRESLEKLKVVYYLIGWYISRFPGMLKLVFRCGTKSAFHQTKRQLGTVPKLIITDPEYLIWGLSDV